MPSEKTDPLKVMWPRNKSGWACLSEEALAALIETQKRNVSTYQEDDMIDETVTRLKHLSRLRLRIETIERETESDLTALQSALEAAMLRSVAADASLRKILSLHDLGHQSHLKSRSNYSGNFHQISLEASSAIQKLAALTREASPPARSSTGKEGA